MRPERAARIYGDGEEAEHVCSVDCLDIGGGGLLDRTQQAEAGIVEQHVNPTEALEGSIRRSLRLCLVSDVEGDCEKIFMFSKALRDAFRISGCRDDIIALREGKFSDVRRSRAMRP
jgi:hypothetical protein